MKFAAVCKLVVSVLFAAAPSVAAEPPEDSAWVILFDGTSLDAWRGYRTEQLPSGWMIEGDTIRLISGNEDLVTRDKFHDFDLRFEWRISRDGNSGVIYRCSTDEETAYMTGPEFQLLDDRGWQIDGKAINATGSLCGMYAPLEDACRPTGEWNVARIVVDQGRVEHWLNGKRIVQAKINSPEWNEQLAQTKFKEWTQFGQIVKGHIALQAHRGRNGTVESVWFRNIKIQPL